MVLAFEPNFILQHTSSKKLQTAANTLRGLFEIQSLSVYHVSLPRARSFSSAALGILHRLGSIVIGRSGSEVHSL